MKLLMITRKVDRDDSIRGFIYSWVKKISENIDELYVITLEKGNTEGLGDNVRIFSLGKEKAYSRWRKFFLFQRYAFKLIKNVDGVFCHQNPIYTVLIYPYAKLYGKRIVTWYTHGKKNFGVYLVKMLSDVILTASKESFPLQSDKIKITGHGIDSDCFRPSSDALKNQEEAYDIVSVGRISPVKKYEDLIEAVNILVNSNKIQNIKVAIIGEPALDKHEAYLKSLEQAVKEKKLTNQIKFIGPIPNKDIRSYYQKARLFINLSGTGSVDKAVLEAMSCGCLVLTSNQAFKRYLDPDFVVFKNNPRDLAGKILRIMNLKGEKDKIREDFRNLVIRHHNLNTLVKRVIQSYE